MNTPIFQERGPAQSNWLCHFCGRTPGAQASDTLDPAVLAMTPQERLASILWDGALRGSVPFGAVNPMVCLSESPPDHLTWLLRTREFPGWGLLVTRAWCYGQGGSPVWYARQDRFDEMQEAWHAGRNWAVRLNPGSSDWQHEREWRMPTSAPDFVVRLQPDDIKAILVEDHSWQPWRDSEEWTGNYLTHTGEIAEPGEAGEPEMVTTQTLPPLWTTAPKILWWDRDAGELHHLDPPH